MSYLQLAALSSTASESTLAGDPPAGKARIAGDTSLLPSGFKAVAVGKGALCITCHNSRNGEQKDIATSVTDDRDPHSAAQGDMLMGENAYFVTAGIAARMLASKTPVSPAICRSLHRPSPMSLFRLLRLFTVASVRGILHNPFYTGRVRHKDKLLPGSHEALISPEVFDLVQAALRWKLLLTMLDGVYVDAKEEKRIVGIWPKPPFRPVLQVAATREGSGIVLLTGSLNLEMTPKPGRVCGGDGRESNFYLQ